MIISLGSNVREEELTIVSISYTRRKITKGLVQSSGSNVKEECYYRRLPSQGQALSQGSVQSSPDTYRKYHATTVNR